MGEMYECHWRNTRRLIGHSFLRNESNQDLVTISPYVSFPLVVIHKIFYYYYYYFAACERGHVW